jgi:hypothetical protein
VHSDLCGHLDHCVQAALDAGVAGGAESEDWRQPSAIASDSAAGVARLSLTPQTAWHGQVSQLMPLIGGEVATGGGAVNPLPLLIPEPNC